jgi:hypothetical protein
MTMAMPADISDFARSGAVKSSAAAIALRLALWAAAALLPWAGIGALVGILIL